jgi:outer membrane immunogenic protein
MIQVSPADVTSNGNARAAGGDGTRPWNFRARATLAVGSCLPQVARRGRRRVMRTILASLGFAALVGFAGAASAADIPRRPAPPPAQAPYFAPAYNWTGFYIGINAGGAWGTSRWDSATSFDVSGGLVGGTLGYNWQSGPFVFGVEGDIDWADISGSTNAACPLGCRTENGWLGTARGRIGYAFDRFLPYVTGGLAFGDIKASTPGFAGGSSTRTGWTAGAGLEFALAGNWTAKVEYLYVDLGSFNCGLNCGAFTPDNVSFKTNILRAGLNFRF